MKRILLCGLPGSGKTTLAEKLVAILGNADWHNADSIRELFNDWDFSPEGRERQMKRVRDFAVKSAGKGRYAVCDFVCPTQELRDAFDPDYIIFMDTIEEGRFEDTNRVFEKPTHTSITIRANEWWDNEAVDRFARLIAVDIKNHEFQTKKPTVQMLGRFQPFHDGHRALFNRALAKHGQVAILVRDMPVSESNPWRAEDICENIELELAEYAGKFRCYIVPNIVNITYGRDVGYTIEQEVFDEEVHNISATNIRNQMREEGKL